MGLALNVVSGALAAIGACHIVTLMSGQPLVEWETFFVSGVAGLLNGLGRVL